MRTEHIFHARKEIWRMFGGNLYKLPVLMNNFFVPISTCLNNMETVYSVYACMLSDVFITSYDQGKLTFIALVKRFQIRIRINW
jgi:hypothetical protein